MDTIINLLTAIGEFFVTVAQWLGNTISSLVYMAQLFSYFCKKVPDYFSWLPDGFVAVIVLIFGIAVVKNLFGKGD